MATQQRERAEVLTDFVGMDYKGAADFDHASAEKCVMPLNAVTPFTAGKSWFVKARVLDKQPVRRWRNAKGTGLISSLTIVDEAGTAMRVTMFGDGVEKYYKMLAVQKVFYFGPSKKAGSSVRPANKQFSSLACDYELALDETSIIEPVKATNIGNIATVTNTNFIRISELINRQDGSMVDIRAIVANVGAVTDVVTKTTGQTLKKRQVQICDSSGPAGTVCDLTLFEDAAKAVPPTVKVGSTITARGMRVKHFNGTAGVTAPRDPDAIKWDSGDAEMTKWWSEGSGRANHVKGTMSNISQRQITTGGQITGAFRQGLDAIEEQKLGTGEKPDYINVKCTIMGFTEKEDRQLFYDACPVMVPDPMSGEKKMCAKKIENFVEGSKCHCQKCDTDVDHVVPRYIASVRIADQTTERWVNMFDEVGQEFFGCPASAFKGNPDHLANFKKQATGSQMTMTLKVKERVTPDGNMRMEAQCIRARHLRAAREHTIDCRNMLGDLERYHNGDASAVQVP